MSYFDNALVQNLAAHQQQNAYSQQLLASGHFPVNPYAAARGECRTCGAPEQLIAGACRYCGRTVEGSHG